jgi:hypothetical protein
MVVNLSHDAVDGNPKFVMNILKELITEYKMPLSNDTLFYFADGEGATFFCDWLLQKKGLVAKPFKFQADSKILALGFVFEENHALTNELLKT